MKGFRRNCLLRVNASDSDEASCTYGLLFNATGFGGYKNGTAALRIQVGVTAANDGDRKAHMARSNRRFRCILLAKKNFLIYNYQKNGL